MIISVSDVRYRQWFKVIEIQQSFVLKRRITWQESGKFRSNTGSKQIVV